MDLKQPIKYCFRIPDNYEGSKKILFIFLLLKNPQGITFLTHLNFFS